MIHSQLQNWSQNKNTWVVHLFLYFAFCFTGFVLLFPCLKLSTTLSPSVPLFHVGTEVATAPAQEQDQNGSMAPVARLLKFCSLALQEVSWTRGGGAGVSWRTRPSCGSAPSRRPWSQAGSTKKAEGCQRFHAATGSAAGLCFENPSWCTLRMIVRKSWRGLLISEGQSECKNKSLWSLVFVL